MIEGMAQEYPTSLGTSDADTITLHIVRGSKHLSLRITLGTQPAG